VRTIDFRGGFWRGAIGFRSAVTPHVLVRLLLFGGFAALVCGNDSIGHHTPGAEISVTP